MCRERRHQIRRRWRTGADGLSLQPDFDLTMAAYDLMQLPNLLGSPA